MLAQVELIKAAAEEQSEAQRLHAKAANLQSEPKEVLNHGGAKVSKKRLLLDLMPRHQPAFQTSTPETNTSWLDDHVDSPYPKTADIDWHGEFEPQSVPELTPDTIPAELGSKDLLQANELVLGLEHGQQPEPTQLPRLPSGE